MIKPEKYIYTLRPKKPDTQQQDQWEGSVKQFKNSVSDATQELQASFKKEMTSVKNEVTQLKNDMQSMIRQEFELQKQSLAGEIDKV